MNPPLKMRFLGDEPITSDDKDQLGLNAFAQLIKTSIYATETPFVYGILGDWGTGKTSTMHLLEQAVKLDVTSDRRFVTIWFNAWLYENEANMIFPLLHAIKKTYDTLPSAGNESRFRSFFRVASTTALAISDLALRAVTKKVFDEAISVEDVKKHMELSEQELNRIEGALSTWVDKVSELQGSFDNLVDSFAEDYAKAHDIDKESIILLIIIDDLDRCLPHTTLSILESIKNFLSVKKCVFLLGLNPTVVYAGIQHKFLGVTVSGREYLEKIINYSFYVPEPDAESVEKFASLRLADLVDDRATRDLLSQRLAAFGNVMSACGYTNPRKIKRVLNRYLLFLIRYAAKLESYDIDSIVKLIVQAEYYPDLFQIYLSEGGQVEQLKKIGTKDFNLADFERDTGVSIAADYAHLARIRKLFEVKNPLQPQVDLVQHAKDVFAITRLR